jgi:FKBP-type peptidyl-prolyl cis-trans isomerase FkpA
MKSILIVGALLALSACKTYSDEDKTTFNQKIEKYLRTSKRTYEKSESGLYYSIEEPGTGDFIKFTDEVSFTYTGKLLSGQVFDQKFCRKPVTFRVSDLIQGWQEAMLYLKKGGKAHLIVPPQLGYGNYELDHIPPNSVLVFDMEITDVR